MIVSASAATKAVSVLVKNWNATGGEETEVLVDVVEVLVPCVLVTVEVTVLGDSVDVEVEVTVLGGRVDVTVLGGRVDVTVPGDSVDVEVEVTVLGGRVDVTVVFAPVRSGIDTADAMAAPTTTPAPTFKNVLLEVSLPLWALSAKSR